MSPAISVLRPRSLDERGLALWADQQAGLLQNGSFRDLDLQNLIEEVRSWGASQKSETRRRLRILLAAKETGIDFTLFPEAPPFTIDEVLDDAFLPREPDLEGAAP